MTDCYVAVTSRTLGTFDEIIRMRNLSCVCLTRTIRAIRAETKPLRVRKRGTNSDIGKIVLGTSRHQLLFVKHRSLCQRDCGCSRIRRTHTHARTRARFDIETPVRVVTLRRIRLCIQQIRLFKHAMYICICINLPLSYSIECNFYINYARSVYLSSRFSFNISTKIPTPENFKL